MTKDLEKRISKLEQKKAYELLNEQGDEFESKLQTYSIILIDQLNWEIRDQYLQLLKNYKEDDSFDFRIRFCERYESIEKVADL